jgi:signal transduction histidine kinase
VPSYQIFSMIVRIACGLIGLSLTLLVLLQLRHDKKSGWFAVLTLIISGMAFDGLLMRVVWQFGGSIDALFNLAGVLTGAIPFVTYIFTNEYLETWTPRRRHIANVLAVCMGITAISGMLLQMHHNVRITSEGFMTYQMYPITVLLLGVGVVCSLMTIRILVQEYRHRKTQTNVRVLLGIGILSSGVLMLTIPFLARYTLEQILYAIGALVIAGPVFQQRLFDPLTQLNRKLARRADQFTALLRVGQQTTSLLALEPLLGAIAREIQRGFGYEGVIIHLPHETYQLLDFHLSREIGLQNVVKVLSLNAQGIAAKAATTRKPVALEERTSEHLTNIKSQLCLPLMIGRDNTLIGVLDIQSSYPDAFGQEDSEVLQILANQTATAIHNAQLFAQAEQARQTADAANRHKTSFLSMMNHELRTPLQTIITRSMWMAQHPELYGATEIPPTYKDDLEQVNRSAEHLQRLIDNVLDLSKIEAGEIDLELCAVPPVAVLDEVITASKSLLQPNVQLHAQFPASLPAIQVDSLRLHQVLSNLLSNACKFCAQGQITVNAIVDGEMLRFSVADTGIGIPLEAHRELFNPFKQATRHIVRQYGGSGLGLSICEKLVQLHGGTIWFESEPNRGTTFYFTIPLATADNTVLDEKRKHNPHTFIFPKTDRQVPLQVLVIARDPYPPATLTSQLRAISHQLLWTHNIEQTKRWAALLEPARIVTIGVEVEVDFPKSPLTFEPNSDWVNALLEHLKHPELTPDAATLPQ